MKLPKRELEKPIDFREGRYQTLQELRSRPRELRILSFAVLGEQNSRELVLKRYEKEPRDKVVHILGKGSFTIEQLENEIKRGTEVGKLAIKNELNWVNFLKEKLESGEIEEGQ
jgi:hypothetical protein